MAPNKLTNTLRRNLSVSDQVLVTTAKLQRFKVTESI